MAMFMTEKELEQRSKETGISKKKLRKLEKKMWKKITAKKPVKPIESLMKESRYRADSYDCITEYGFLPIDGNIYSDSEIDEYINDLRMYTNSPFDCSGQRFTMWIDWHRNQSGLISVIHRIGLDV